MIRGMAVTVTSVEATPTAVVAAATTWAEFPRMWGPMLDKVWTFLRTDAPPGLNRRGRNVMFYKDDAPNVEVGVEVTGSFDAAGSVVPSVLPGGLVATATHTGPIGLLGDTHRAVREWSEANGFRLAGPRWEVYGHPDPSTGEFDVEVFWSIEPP
jgi:effector-binding domain-containing protein